MDIRGREVISDSPSSKLQTGKGGVSMSWLLRVSFRQHEELAPVGYCSNDSAQQTGIAKTPNRTEAKKKKKNPPNPPQKANLGRSNKNKN